MLRFSKGVRCTAVTAASAVEPLITSFVTDLEGDGLYFDTFVANSKALQRDPMTRELSLRDGFRFVYGGDLFDKGTHDLRLCRELTALKAKYPDRVTLIVGNRDLQKHKFQSMLRPEWAGRPISVHKSPYYMAANKSYAEFLATERGGAGHSEYNFLSWLVSYCYGAPRSLFAARQELFEEGALPQCRADGSRKSYAELREDFYGAVLAATSTSSAATSAAAKTSDVPSAAAIEQFLESKVSEGDIVSLYKRIASPHPPAGASSSPLSAATASNIVAQYADAAQLAAIHDGVLFVHGAAKSSTMGYVPSLALEERAYGPSESLQGTIAPDVDAWVDGLNSFYRGAIAEWRANPHFDAAALAAAEASAEGSLTDGRFPKRGGGALFAYGHSRSSQGKSAIINSYFNDSKPAAHATSASGYGDLAYVDMKAVSYLGLGGVSAVMVGHQPVSDVPLVIAQPGLRVVCGDTSYCGKNGGRGLSVAEVLHSGEDGSIRVHGATADGAPYDFTVDEDGPRAVGRCIGNGWWVRAELSDGTYLVRRTKDRFFSHESRILTLEALEAEVLAGKDGHLYERSAVAGEDAPLPFAKEDLRPLRNHEKADPSIKTKRCCGTRTAAPKQ